MKNFIYILLILTSNYFAQVNYDSLKHVADTLKGEAKTSALIKLSANYLYEGKLDTAQQFIDKAFKIAYANDFKKKLPAIYLIQAEINLDKHKYKEAIEIAKKSIDSYVAVKDSSQLLRLYIDIGNSYWYLSDFPKALESYLTAHEIGKKLKIKDPVTLHNIALIYMEMKEYDKALKYFEIALTKTDSVTNPNNYAVNLSNIGNLYIIKKDFKKALKVLKQAERYAYKINNERTQGLIYGNIGDVYFELGNYELSRKYHNAAIEIGKKLNDNYSLANSYFTLGRIDLKQNRLNKAEKILLKAKDLIKDERHFQLQSDILGELAKIYNKTRKYKKAYHNSLTQLALRDSMFENTVNSKISEMQTKFETHEKELALQNNILQLQRQKDLTNFFLIVSVLIIILMLAIINRYFLKNKANKKIAAQNAELEKLNATKDKFFSIIAHDLKSPFTAIMGITEILEEDFERLSKGEVKEFLKVLRTSSNKSVKLLENLMHWSMTQTGKIAINKEFLNLNEIVQENIDLLNESAKAKNITIINDVNPELSVYADDFTISTVIRNLINNAIKFTNEGGKIVIGNKINEDQVLVSVKDSGIGIQKEDIDKLFRIDISHTTIGTNKEKGTGLGLILCKEFVEKNGGTIWVKSDIGKGSEFYFTLPFNKKNVKTKLNSN